MSTVVIGKAPLTLVRRKNGRTDYVYFGQPAPSDLIDGELERLVADGYLREIEVVDDPELMSVPVGAAPPSLADLTAEQLLAYATEHGVDTGKATSVDGLLAKIGEAGHVITPPAAPAS